MNTIFKEYTIGGLRTKTSVQIPHSTTNQATNKVAQKPSHLHLAWRNSFVQNHETYGNTNWSIYMVLFSIIIIIKREEKQGLHHIGSRLKDFQRCLKLINHAHRHEKSSWLTGAAHSLFRNSFIETQKAYLYLLGSKCQRDGDHWWNMNKTLITCISFWCRNASHEAVKRRRAIAFWCKASPQVPPAPTGKTPRTFSRCTAALAYGYDDVKSFHGGEFRNFVCPDPASFVCERNKIIVKR